MNQINRLRLADWRANHGETVATCTGRGSSARAGGEITVQRGSDGSHHVHGATDAGRGLSARVGGEASVAGVTSHENLASGAVRAAGSLSLGQQRRDTRDWSNAEVASLREYWKRPEFTHEDMAHALQRSVNAVQNKAARLGLKARPVPRRPPPPTDPWSYAELELLRTQVGRVTCDVIAEQIGRTTAAVHIMAHRLGLSTRAVLGDRRTATRKEILVRDWPIGRAVVAITSDMNALPGTPMSAAYVAKWAADLGLRRPVGFPGAKPIQEPEQIGPEPRRMTRAEKVARTCLCCQRPFDAPGRFIRLCDVCRKRDEGVL